MHGFFNKIQSKVNEKDNKHDLKQSLVNSVRRKHFRISSTYLVPKKNYSENFWKYQINIRDTESVRDLFLVRDNYNWRNSFTAQKVPVFGVFSGPYFSAFGLNTEKHSVPLRIQSECGKISRKTLNMGIFEAVILVGPFLQNIKSLQNNS